MHYKKIISNIVVITVVLVDTINPSVIEWYPVKNYDNIGILTEIYEKE